MKQPKITLDGVTYQVADIWWDSDGKVSHLAYYTNGYTDVKTIFDGEYDLEELLKEGQS